MRKLGKMITLLAATTIMAVGMITTAFAADAITPTEFYYGTEAMTAPQTFSYNNSNFINGKYYQGVVVPVNVTKAGSLKVVTTATSVLKDINIEVYSDAACTNRMEYLTDLKVGSTTVEDYVSFSNAGTYYIKFDSYCYNGEDVYTNTFTVQTGFYTLDAKVIKDGETITYYRNSGEDKYVFNYTATKTGKVTVTLPYSMGSYVTFVDSGKTVCEKKWVSDLTSDSQASFAVKNGKTYKFEVTSNGTSYGKEQSFSLKETAVKAKSRAKRAKAVNIKKGKTVKGIVTAGDKKANWYKFTVKKKKPVTITLDGNVENNLKFTIYNKKGKKIDSTSYYGYKRDLKLTYSTTYGKANAGTYYIKIEKANANSNGVYSIKWK